MHNSAQLRCFENGNDDFGGEAFWIGDAARVGYFVPLNGPLNGYPPSCLLSMVSQTISSTYFIIIDSKTFAAIGVIDIGIMSVFTDISGLVFGSGIILADFHTLGRTPSRKEQLKILASGAARQSACSFNIHAGMLSGPVDLLVVTFRRAETVSSTLIINSFSLVVSWLHREKIVTKPYLVSKEAQLYSL